MTNCDGLRPTGTSPSGARVFDRCPDRDQCELYRRYQYAENRAYARGWRGHPNDPDAPDDDVIDAPHIDEECGEFRPTDDES